ncbi:MAG TPA: class I SAM-dependent methyltransferase [Acidimicrobiia bacterium]
MTESIANVQMAEEWNGPQGDDWARDWRHYDLAVRRYHLRMLDAAGIASTDHVLDVGCGNGESTRDAARAAARGDAFGVDLSKQMLERARALAAADGLTNVFFEQADAQVHAFEPGRHDVVVSRFGVMFFADPVAAFTNIGAAIRPGGRIVALAWQGLDRNEWLLELRGALAMGRDVPAPAAGAPGPFGLADPAHVHSVMTGAGFRDVEVAAVREQFRAGEDAAGACEFLCSTPVARGLLRDLDSADRARALDLLRGSIAEHATGEGVLYGSAAWLITATRPQLSSPPCRS